MLAATAGSSSAQAEEEGASMVTAGEAKIAAQALARCTNFASDLSCVARTGSEDHRGDA
jgi:hypothetical protein